MWGLSAKVKNLMTDLRSSLNVMGRVERWMIINIALGMSLTFFSVLTPARCPETR
jgi:hypothetical protein